MNFSRLAARALRSQAIVRAPIALYRVRLGWLLGSRVLMLEHTGRRSGRARYVCLEVVERLTTNEIMVASGFGEHAQWHRNLRQEPRCFVSTGRMRRVPAVAVLLGEEESATVLARYQRAHPRAWARLRDVLEEAVGHPVESLPMVRLTLSH